jgi:D-alanyl-D-alanine carboxypeptidase
LRRLLPVLLVLILLAVPREGHASFAPHARSPGAPLTGVAGWTGGFPSFNVHSAPRPDAPVVATLQPGEQVRVLRTVQGSPVNGIGLWYQLQLSAQQAYVLASGISYLHGEVPWTGVTSSNAEANASAIVSYAGPWPDMPSDASFAPGEQMTVLGVAHGAALEPGDDVWYRVSTGSYRAAFIYSAYLKFAHPGVSPVPLPLVGAAAALAVDMDSLRVLYSRNATVPRPPASLVKMMTAAVALDHFRPNTVIRVPRGALSVGAAVGGSAMGLLPGERLSLRDLLYGLLLPSGNDAAYTIAQAVAGSQQSFAALMNAKAAALGLEGTHFAQSYGFDEADQYSTAWDLMRLARYDLRHYALFDRIVATAYRYIGPGRTHPDFALHNQNRLLGIYPGAIGIKTGTTPAAGQNLVAAARRKGHRIIVVVLGSSDRYADATALLNYAVAIR